MLPTSSTLSVVSAPTPPKPLYLRRSLIAAAAASLAVLLLLAAAYAPWRSDLPPAALLGRPAAPTARFYSFDLVREYPHDPDAFTQGLLYGGNDTLFESTGLYHRVMSTLLPCPTIIYSTHRMVVSTIALNKGLYFWFLNSLQSEWLSFQLEKYAAYSY
jgi:hypothetical protein